MSYIWHHKRYWGVDPETFKTQAPSEEERTWFKVQTDGPEKGDIGRNARWLERTGIHDWYWMDRAPDRMVWRIDLYFKNEQDLAMFLLWWS